MILRILIILASLVLFGCGDDEPTRTVTIKFKNIESVVQCQTTVAGIEESFEATEGFEKSSEASGFYYVSCQKQTSGDNSTVVAEVLLDDEIVDSGAASEEFGIATASFLYNP